MISLGASDGSVKMVKVGEEGGKLGVAERKVYVPEAEGTVCLMHDTNQSHLACARNEGSFSLFDLETGTELVSSSLHKFDIWFCKFSVHRENELYTCSDDMSFKVLDFRQECFAL